MAITLVPAIDQPRLSAAVHAAGSVCWHDRILSLRRYVQVHLQGHEVPCADGSRLLRGQRNNGCADRKLPLLRVRCRWTISLPVATPSFARPSLLGLRMRFKRVSTILAFSLALSACADHAENPISSAPTQLSESASAARSVELEITWKDLSDEQLWRYVVEADRTVDVGLRGQSGPAGMNGGRLLLTPMEWADARRDVSSVSGVSVTAVDTLLPIMRLRLQDAVALGLLRTLRTVAYVEPGYFINSPPDQFWQESGCEGGTGTETASITPGDVLPWNYPKMWIDKAWERTSGSGVWIGLVDTGVDWDQSQFHEDFSNGWSSGRSISLDYTDGGTWSDECGHGTRMAGVIGAPRDGKNMLGVAWGANLHSVRVDNDVILDALSVTEVRNGIRKAAQSSRIVSMAFGTPDRYQSIVDEIDYWYYNYDRLFIGAAGTSASATNGVLGVMFPANLSRVVAVTGLDERGNVCSSCHYGPEVEFAAYVEQSATGATGIWKPNISTIGGSSNATGIMAGMAALTWERYPSMSRTGLVARFRQAGQTGTKRSDIGYGAVNAFGAVGGLYKVEIEGPAVVSPGVEYTYTAKYAIAEGGVTFLWHTGETTQSITVRMPSDGSPTYELSVRVTDVLDGFSITDYQTVRVTEDTSCATCAG